MIKITLKIAGKNRLCYAKLVGLSLLLLVRSPLFGMHGAGDMNSTDGVSPEKKQDIASAQEATIVMEHDEQDFVAHWDRVSALLTLSNRQVLEREYSKEQLGAAVSALQHSPEGTIGRAAYDDLVRGQRAQSCMLPILAELHKQNNQRQELAESKIRMNCTCCSWWWLLNWGSRAAWVVLLSFFPTKAQCDW